MAADPAFWYVRDVMVDPPWQGRGVGLALMGALAAWARANVPAGALVGLFTGQRLHRFYERFGFVGPEQGLVGMHQTIQRPR
jgi:GNAT superfamily N-acetyltransferase